MSDADHKATSVLLPASSLAIFSNDRTSLEATEKLAEDWRFARVKIKAEEGDVKTAIKTYEEMKSPDLIILQTDSIDDSFTASLGELAGNCEEGTAAIVVGPVNDVHLYRQLIEMGVSDYLVKPLETEVLADVIAKALIARIGVKGSHLISVVGSKGGVGTTSIVQALAWAATDLLKQKTLVVDAAGGWSPLSVGLGFEPATTLAEAAKAAENSDEDSLNRMLFEASDKLHVLATGGDVMLDQSISAAQMEMLLDSVMARYPLVIADLSHAPTDIGKATLARSNQIFLVSTPNLAALRLARSLLLEMKDLRGGSTDDVAMIVNMQGLSAKNEVSIKDAEEAMDFKVRTTIPFTPEAFMAQESASQKLSQNSQGASILKDHILPLLTGFVDAGEEDVQIPEKASGGGFLGGLFGGGKGS